MNRKKRFYYFAFLCFLVSAAWVFSEIKEIHGLAEIPIEEFSQKTLVMFDIDDVLIYPRDALLQNWRLGWKPEGVREWTAEEDTIAWMHVKFQLMDLCGPKILDVLYEKGILTIGFTSFSVDQPDIVKSIPEWRSRHLEELGLHFRMNKELFFLVQNESVPPSFEKGVLYCGNMYKKDKDNKGKILSLFLGKLDWTPEKIVLVDDGQTNLESVNRELFQRGISFLGFLYIPKELDPIDEKIAKLQYETIIHQKMWLSDEEAKERFVSACTGR